MLQYTPFIYLYIIKGNKLNLGKIKLHKQGKYQKDITKLRLFMKVQNHERQYVLFKYTNVLQWEKFSLPLNS